METDKQPLGFVLCKTCMTPKAIFQGTGNRKTYVHGRCECGLDNRTGKAHQDKLNAYQSRDEIEAQIEALNNPAPAVESEPLPAPETPPKQAPKPSDKQAPESSDEEGMSMGLCVGAGVVLGGLFGGLIRLVRA